MTLDELERAAELAAAWDEIRDAERRFNKHPSVELYEMEFKREEFPELDVAIANAFTLRLKYIAEQLRELGVTVKKTGKA